MHLNFSLFVPSRVVDGRNWFPWLVVKVRRDGREVVVLARVTCPLDGSGRSPCLPVG